MCPTFELRSDTGCAHHLGLESHCEHELGGALVDRHDPLRGLGQRVPDAAIRVRRLHVLDLIGIHRAEQVGCAVRQHLGVEEVDAGLP